jgi:hypothetical protein
VKFLRFKIPARDHDLAPDPVSCGASRKDHEHDQDHEQEGELRIELK